ncbi:MAG: redox-regulated ATPase YchF [Candidatus Levybacteria bacterium]|nr:redox-regulated ATPase YchF [Candidatus Levybacteria bacterium]
MNLSVGIVGLPNVGKSTLFNALLRKQAALAANYPFATIEPNIGIVPVPDERLIRLAEIAKIEHLMSNLPPIKPATVEFVDIAGLVKGASVGAGLGNKFLSHIREVKIIAHVVRAFEDPNVVREGSVDAKSDYETIRTELALSDITTIAASKQKNKRAQELLEKLENTLNKGENVSALESSKEDQEFVRSLNLLSSKPEIIVLNVPEAEYTKEGIVRIEDKYEEILRLPRQGGIAQDDHFVVICAKVEEELAALSGEEQKEYLYDLGLEKSGLERLIQKAYQELGLISFLTAGEKEVRAWTVKKDTNAKSASGEIHTDFIKNFIKAEVVSFDDFVANNGPALRSEATNGWKGSRAAGKTRLEGKDYIVQDGDVIEFKVGR